MMHMIQTFNKTTTFMNETFNKTTTSMNEMFHKSQASTETTLERVQCSIAAMADRVQALETRLPNVTTDPNVVADPNAAAAATHVDNDPFAEDPGIDNDEHFEFPDPPPHPRRPFNR
jgi:Tfp pilus assembly protein PilO